MNLGDNRWHRKYYCDKCVKKNNCDKVVKKRIRENINKSNNQDKSI